MNKLIAWDVLMNHSPKPKVHQGLIYWKRGPLWIAPTQDLLLYINELDLSRSSSPGSQSPFVLS